MNYDPSIYSLTISHGNAVTIHWMLSATPVAFLHLRSHEAATESFAQERRLLRARLMDGAAEVSISIGVPRYRWVVFVRLMSWKIPSINGWFGWGYPHDLGNLHVIGISLL